MSTYEDLTGHHPRDAEYADSLRPGRAYADSVQGRDSVSPVSYDMCSIPSASLVHLDIDMARARADSRGAGSRGPTPTEDPFADRPSPDEADPRAPLFSDYAHERSDSRGSAASSVRPSSRWRAHTPVSTRGAYSPAPTDSRAGSRSGASSLFRGQSKRREDGSVDLATPFEWDGMEDPFADPNRHGVD